MMKSSEFRSEGGRDQEMAAIRQILAEVKSDIGPGAGADAPLDDLADDQSPAKGDAETGGADVVTEFRNPAAPSQPEPRAPVRIREDEATLDDADDLRLDGVAKAIRTKPSRFDVAGLRRSHDKRVKKYLRSEARRKKSGAFMTGFTLVTLVAAALTGLYVLHPQIIAAAPEMEPAMTEYVTTVDLYRAQTHESTAGLSAWLDERIAGLRERME